MNLKTGYCNNNAWRLHLKEFEFKVTDEWPCLLSRVTKHATNIGRRSAYIGSLVHLKDGWVFWRIPTARCSFGRNTASRFIFEFCALAQTSHIFCNAEMVKEEMRFFNEIFNGIIFFLKFFLMNEWDIAEGNGFCNYWRKTDRSGRVVIALNNEARSHP